MRDDFADDVVRCFENGGISFEEAEEWLRRRNNVVFFDIAERSPRPLPSSTESQQVGSSSTNEFVNEVPFEDVPVHENPIEENDPQNPLEQVPMHLESEEVLVHVGRSFTFFKSRNMMKMDFLILKAFFNTTTELEQVMEYGTGVLNKHKHDTRILCGSCYSEIPNTKDRCWKCST